jgi:hypothetical protein
VGLSCSTIVNDIQCISSDLLSGICTWIYESNDYASVGECVLKSDNEYSCSDINRISQCENGAEITVLNNKCGIYSGKCEQKCEFETSSETCKSRSMECFWLDGNIANEIAGRCITLVFFIYIYYCYYFFDIWCIYFFFLCCLLFLQLFSILFF